MRYEYGPCSNFSAMTDCDICGKLQFNSISKRFNNKLPSRPHRSLVLSSAEVLQSYRCVTFADQGGHCHRTSVRSKQLFCHR